jgi:hypothetical protein
MLVGEAEGFITEIAVLFHPATAHVSTTSLFFLSAESIFSYISFMFIFS